MSSQTHPLVAVAVELDKMREAAVADAHPMLALLLQLARDEATEEVGKRTAKRAPKRVKASNVVRFPRRRLAKRRNARALAGNDNSARGEIVKFSDYAIA